MLGIMHYDRDGSPAFVFDMMEPDRPKVDKAVLAFLRTEALHLPTSRSWRMEWCG
jgi:CRISPR-associated protein Cas1